MTCDLTVHSISSVIRRPLPPNLSRGNSEGRGSRGVARLSSRHLAHFTGQTIAPLEPHPLPVSHCHHPHTLTHSHTDPYRKEEMLRVRMAALNIKQPEKVCAWISSNLIGRPLHLQLINLSPTDLSLHCIVSYRKVSLAQ